MFSGNGDYTVKPPEPVESPSYGWQEQPGQQYLNVSNLCQDCQQSSFGVTPSRDVYFFKASLLQRDIAISSSSRPTDTATSEVPTLVGRVVDRVKPPSPMCSPAFGSPEVKGWGYVSVANLCQSCRAAARGGCSKASAVTSNANKKASSASSNEEHRSKKKAVKKDQKAAIGEKSNVSKKKKKKKKKLPASGSSEHSNTEDKMKEQLRKEEMSGRVMFKGRDVKITPIKRKASPNSSSGASSFHPAKKCRVAQKVQKRNKRKLSLEKNAHDNARKRTRKDESRETPLHLLEMEWQDLDE